MLYTIPADVITYVIVPYLYVPDMICMLAQPIVKPDKLLSNVVYHANHGIKHFTTIYITTIHFRHGKYHCVDGPAIEYTSGIKLWYYNGKAHRVDGPAIEDKYGNNSWYQYDKLHRTDGPAVELYNGIKFWYINDIMYNTEESYNAARDKFIQAQ